MGRLLLVVVAFAAGAAASYAYTGGAEPARSLGDLPIVRQNDPAPETPPVVWVSGRLVSVAEQRIVVREGDGPEIALRRFAQGATSFHRLDAGEWILLAGPSIAGAEGQAVCIESLLDGDELLALRVFVGAGCSPVP